MKYGAFDKSQITHPNATTLVSVHTIVSMSYLNINCKLAARFFLYFYPINLVIWQQEEKIIKKKERSEIEVLGNTIYAIVMSYGVKYTQANT